MPTPVPSDPSKEALRWLVRRVIVFSVAAVAVVVAFAIAWRLGAFSPSHR
jgi:hypothetical protein